MFKLRNATGNIVPPTDEANEIIPKAVDCLLLNQWATMLITGPNVTPHEIYTEAVRDRQLLDARGRSTDTNAETLTE